ncbi:MAG: TIGR03013 family XrtA/PEP-CTERM system glycosyltransferase [Gammaproteobacteria bacterium]
MLRIFRHYIPTSLVLLGVAETLILLVSIYVGVSFGLALSHGAESAQSGQILPQALVFSCAMLLGMIAMGFYQREQRDGPLSTMIRLALSFCVGFAVMGFVYLVFPQFVVGTAAFSVALGGAFIGIATCRLICLSHTDASCTKRVLVMGAGERARQIQNLRRAADRVGITIVGYLDLGTDSPQVEKEKIVSQTGSLLELAEKYAIDEIVIATDDRRKGLPLEGLLECKMHGVAILQAPEFYERQLGKIRLDSVNPGNMVFAEGFTQAIVKRTEKRIVDIVISSWLLVLTLPVSILVALAVLLEGGGPVLYRQERVGLKGKHFTVYKFRSMRTDAEQDGVAVWADSVDARVTRIGCILRKFRLDELPQLYNVLKGDMSFVGPRPERPQFVEELSDVIPFYQLRHYVKPGLTGWAQVCYPYGASINDAREKLQYDLYYLKNYSLFLDLNVILLTVQVILWGKGAR